MFGLILGQVRHARGRTLTLASGIGVAAASFSLLTATITTSQATVNGTVRENLRPAYDILVRPTGAATAIEGSSNTVNDNFLSGLFGGISTEQLQQVRAVEGVEVAAPIAMIGYVLETVQLPVTIRADQGKSGDRMYRLQVARSTDRGLTAFPAGPEFYALVTERQLMSLEQAGTVAGRGGPGTVPGPGGAGTFCQGGIEATGAGKAPALPSVCTPRKSADDPVLGFVRWTFPMLLAAVDPVAEQQLSRLGDALVGGRYLARHENVTEHATNGSKRVDVPVLVSTNPYVDGQATVTVERIDAAAVLGAGPKSHQDLQAAVVAAPGTPVQTVALTSADAYAGLLQSMASDRCCVVDAYWTTKPSTMTKDGTGAVVPGTVQNPASVWTSELIHGGVDVPVDAGDVNFRPLVEHVGSNTADSVTHLSQVGRFDPEKLAGFSQVAHVPLQTYNPPVALGGDDSSRTALAGKPLMPNSNPAGYLQQPPMIITTLDAIGAFGGRAFPDAELSSPISAVRLRVGGLHGTARQQLDQVARVAYEVQRKTGLLVDITTGASGTETAVALPAGKFGRPALALREPWVSKGVGLRILDSVDRKSLVLFVLVLITTALFLANGVYASVRSRRRHIGLLRAIGWSRRAVFRLILGEVAVIGAGAGIAGTLLSLAVIRLAQLRIPLDRVLLVSPVAVLLAVLAGAVPAWLATRGQPMDTLAPATVAPRRVAPVRGIIGLAVSNAGRRPGRAVLGAVALGIGITAMTVLLSVDRQFTSDVAGSTLGDLVTTQVRGVDYISTALAVLLGAVSVADVVYLGLRERSPELGVLLATGWMRRHLNRVATVEGLITGVLGSALGAGVGLALGGRVLPALASVTLGIAVVLVTTRITLSSIRRLPLVATLAEEE